MPGFVIFVFVLTFAYVVYFSVMITLDLHSKKDEKKTDEETIDVSSMQQTTTTEELNKENEENMEEIEPAPQYCFYPDEFMQNLNDKHNKRKIEKRNAIDKL